MMQGSLFLLVMGAILLLAGATHLFLQLLGGIIRNGLKKRGPQQYLGGADSWRRDDLRRCYATYSCCLAVPLRQCRVDEVLPERRAAICRFSLQYLL